MPNIINKLEVENSSGITTCDIGAKSENISYGGSNVKSVLDGILNDEVLTLCRQCRGKCPRPVYSVL
jgi:hypothetical protein